MNLVQVTDSGDNLPCPSTNISSGHSLSSATITLSSSATTTHNQTSSSSSRTSSKNSTNALSSANRGANTSSSCGEHSYVWRHCEGTSYLNISNTESRSSEVSHKSGVTITKVEL